jgi:hypothetical protein
LDVYNEVFIQTLINREIVCGDCLWRKWWLSQ